MYKIGKCHWKKETYFVEISLIYQNKCDEIRQNDILTKMKWSDGGPPLWHVGVSNIGKNIATLRATSLFVLMHSGIVNGYQLLCDAHTLLEPHRGTADLFLFYSLLSFPLFLFMCLTPWQFYFFSSSLLLPVVGGLRIEHSISKTFALFLYIWWITSRVQLVGIKPVSQKPTLICEQSTAIV